MIPKALTEKQALRFNSYIHRTDDCWIWVGDKNRFGYGRFSLLGKKFAAHRVSYQISGKKLIDGLVLDHLCRTPACVRPEHLEQVTHKTNTQRGMAGYKTGAQQRAKTRCPEGHSYDDSNTYWYKGKRSCRECARSSSREYQRRLRAQNPLPPKTSCQNGHPWNEGTYHMTPKGVRLCRTCVRERQRRYRAKKKVETINEQPAIRALAA